MGEEPDSGALEDDEYMSNWLHKHFGGRSGQIIVWMMSLLSAVCAIVVFQYDIRCVMKGGQVDPSSLQYQLYKNTFYQFCNGNPEDALDNPACPLDDSKTLFQGSNFVTSDWEPGSNVAAFDHAINQTRFCDCFPGWLVVPSDLTPSTLYTDGLSLWLEQTMTTLGLLWSVASTFGMAFWKSGGNDGNKDEAHIPWYSWPLYMYDVVSVIMWLHGYSNTSALHFVSPYAWLTPLRYLFLIRRDPIRARLQDRYSRFIDDEYEVRHCVFLLISAALIVLFGMTAAEMSIQQKFDSDILERAAIATAEIVARAPGSTSCTYDDLSAFVALGTPVHGVRYSPTSIYHLRTTVFVVYSIVGILSGLFEASLHWKSRSECYNNVTLWPIVVVVSLFQLIVTIWVNAPTGSLFRQAAASVTYSIPCTAVNVAPSPFRGYLDVGSGSAAYRAARAWFNT